MIYLITLPVLFTMSVASTASAVTETPAPGTDLDQVVRDSLQGKLSEIEHFSVLRSSSCSPYCPEGWVTYSGRCFKYFNSTINWTSAEAHCLSLGANLVSIHNENEYQLVKALIRFYDPKENPVWIGLSACHKKFTWFWSDGSKLSYTNWIPNEPNFQSRECCVHMNFGAEMNWNDIPCNFKFAFVCAKKLP